MAHKKIAIFLLAALAAASLAGSEYSRKSDSEDLKAGVNWLSPVTVANEAGRTYIEKNVVRFHPSGMVYTCVMDDVGDGATKHLTIKLYSYDGDKVTFVKMISDDVLKAYEPDMVITPDGFIHIAWAEATSGNADVHHVKYRYFNGAEWSSIITLKSLTLGGITGGWNLEKIDDLRLDVDDDGNVFITLMIWPDARGYCLSRYGDKVYVDSFPMAGRAKHPSIAAGKDYVWVTWQQLEGAAYTVRVSRRNNKAGSSWNYSTVVCAGGGHRPFIRTDNNDVPHVIYMRDTASGSRELHYRVWKGSEFSGSWMVSDSTPLLYHTPNVAPIDLENVLIASQNWAGGVVNYYNWLQGGKWGGLKSAIAAGCTMSFGDCDLNSSGIGVISYSDNDSVKILLSGKLVVNDLPVVTIKADKDTLFWGETVKLDGSSSYDRDGQIVRYEWKAVTDNVVIDSTSATAEYAFKGKWNNVKIRLTAIDNKGGRGVAEKTFTVKALYSALNVAATPKKIVTLIYNRDGNVVTWQENPKNEQAGYTIASYLIFSKITGSADSTYVLKGTVPADRRAFADVNVEAGKKYTYAVAAVDSEGHQSPYKNQ